MKIFFSDISAFDPEMTIVTTGSYIILIVVNQGIHHHLVVTFAGHLMLEKSMTSGAGVVEEAEVSLEVLEEKLRVAGDGIMHFLTNYKSKSNIEAGFSIETPFPTNPTNHSGPPSKSHYWN